MGPLLVAVLLAQADGGSDFASAMRDEARRSEAACAAFQRAHANDCVISDEPCTVKRVLEFQDEHGWPGFLVIFKDALEDDPSNELFGHLEVFGDSGRRLPLLWGTDVLDDSGKLTQLAGGPLFLAQRASLEIRCRDDAATPLIQQLLIVNALPRTPLVLALGPPSRRSSATPCDGPVCTKQGLQVTRPAPGPDWSWDLACGKTCTVRIGPANALERGRPSAVFTWNTSAKRFDGPKEGAGFLRLDASLTTVGPQLERLSRQYCQPAASPKKTQDLRTR